MNSHKTAFRIESSDWGPWQKWTSSERYLFYTSVGQSSNAIIKRTNINVDTNVCLRRSLVDVALLVRGMYQEPRFPPPRVSVRSSKARWQTRFNKTSGWVLRRCVQRLAPLCTPTIAGCYQNSTKSSDRSFSKRRLFLCKARFFLSVSLSPSSFSLISLSHTQNKRRLTIEWEPYIFF